MGFIYVLGNKAMPGLIKIGKTSLDVRKRIDELFNTPGVPFPFDIIGVYEVRNIDQTERKLHKMFDVHRVNSKREFYTPSTL